MRPQRCPPPPNTAAFSCLTKPAHFAATHPPSQATKSVARPAGEPRPALQVPYAVQEPWPPPPPLIIK